MGAPAPGLPCDGASWDYRTIFDFCRSGLCWDGWGPFATFAMDGSGARSHGVGFELTPWLGLSGFAA